MIPSLLRSRSQWLVWKLVQDPNEPKPRKVPFYVTGSPRLGQQGTDTDVSLLADYDTAVAACDSGRYTGLGFALLPNCGIVALDFDHCVRDGHVLDSRIDDLISGTYAEISPSGTGLRAFFAGDLISRKDNAHKSKRMGGVAGADRLDGNFDIEVFGTNGFVTVTGNHTSDTKLWGLEDTVLPLTPAVLDMYRSRFGDRPSLLPATQVGGVDDLAELGAAKLGWSLEQGREYLFDCSASVSREEWLNALMAVHYEFDGSEDALELADQWSSTGDSYGGRGDVEARWRSFGRRSGAGSITGRWLLAWRRDQLAAQSDDKMRDALLKMQTLVDAAEDMLVVQTKVMPQISQLLLEFPILEIEAYSIVAARAKKFGTPVNKSEFKKMIRVERAPAVDSDLPKLTEFGNTDRLLRKYGDDLMYVPDIGTWFVWSGVYWRKATGGATEIEHYAKQTIRDLPMEADLHPDPSEFYMFCSMSQRAQMVANMVRLASSDWRVVVPASELDKHSHYLGVKNGVVDLRTGELIAPDRKMRITLSTGCDYNANAKAPLFERTLRDVFFDDTETVEYMLRALGYALMGNPKEDVMFIPFGNGANGKSTIFNAVRETFGSYARSAEANSFISDGKSGGAGGAREDLVRLRGSRFVYVNEPDEGGVLREGAVKSMTGGDAITARGLYATASVELVPTWTVFMPTNHKPIITGSDNGIWRRMGLIPFERNFEHDATVVQDKGRKEKLKAEMSGILALLVRAAIRYQQVGLTAPEKMRVARKDYRDDMDLLSEWLDECCETGPGLESKSMDLWDSWRAFAERRNQLRYITSSISLGRRLETRFKAKKAPGGIRVREGISLKTAHNLF